MKRTRKNSLNELNKKAVKDAAEFLYGINNKVRLTSDEAMDEFLCEMAIKTERHMEVFGELFDDKLSKFNQFVYVIQ